MHEPYRILCSEIFKMIIQRSWQAIPLIFLVVLECMVFTPILEELFFGEFYWKPWRRALVGFSGLCFQVWPLSLGIINLFISLSAMAIVLGKPYGIICQDFYLILLQLF